jgi:hypothetical protein
MPTDLNRKTWRASSVVWARATMSSELTRLIRLYWELATIKKTRMLLAAVGRQHLAIDCYVRVITSSK